MVPGPCQLCVDACQPGPDSLGVTAILDRAAPVGLDKDHDHITPVQRREQRSAIGAGQRVVGQGAFEVGEFAIRGTNQARAVRDVRQILGLYDTRADTERADRVPEQAESAEAGQRHSAGDGQPA